MAKIPASTLAYMRNAAAGLFEDTCTIKARSNTKTASYIPQDDFVDVATNVPCRVMPSSNSARRNDAQQVANRQVVPHMYQISVAYDKVIEAGYQIVTGGNTYNVVSIDRFQTQSPFIVVTATKL